MHGSGIVRFDKNNQRAIESGSSSETDWNRRLVSNFIQPLREGIDAYIEYYIDRKGRPSKALDLIKLVLSEQAAYITLKVMLDVLGSVKFDANWLTTTIGRRIEDQVRFTFLENAAPKYIKAIKESLKKRNSIKYDHQHKVMVASEKKLVESDKPLQEELERWLDWSEVECKHVGSCLVNIFEKCVTFEGGPIIRKEMRIGKKGTMVYISPTDAITGWIEKYKVAIGCLAPDYAPCVIPPRDWVSPFEGGFHTEGVAGTMSLAKVRNKKHLRLLTKQQMPAVYECVNTLQRVRWAVSERVLATANELVKLG